MFLLSWGWSAACIGLRAQSIPNPSFEANSFANFPGLIGGNGGTITGWTATGTGVGLNPAGGNPFADNGAVPNGNNVAFLQGTASLATTISGLVSGQTYTVTFRANRRAINFDPVPAWSLNGGADVSFTASPAVGGQNPYRTVTGTFNATGTTAAMVIKNKATADATLLIDAFSIAIVPAQISVFTGANTLAGNARTDNVGTQTFASTAVGSSSASQTFTIQSTGTGNLAALALSVTGANAGDFSVSTLASTSLAPTSSTTFTVTFSPTAAGNRNAVINIASNDSARNPFRINVSGTGLVPQINLFDGASTSPTDALVDNTGTVSLGSVVYGNSGAAHTFTIQNSGAAPLTGLVLSVSGSARTDFTVGNVVASTLAPGASTTFTVTFTPSAGGTRSALLNVGSNDPNTNPFRINISGTGLIPKIGVFTGSSTAPVDARGNNIGTFTFANTPLAESSTAQTFTIQNTGTATLSGLALSVSSGNAAEFSVGSLGSTSLAPGASTTFTVTFSPAALGTRNSAVFIASNDPTANPFRINVAGSGAFSRNAALSNLTVSSGTLAPGFDSPTTSYAVSVPFLTTSMTLAATRSDANASVTIQGSPAASPVAVSLSVGANAVPVVVTAQDGVTTRTYTVTITRGANQPPVPGTHVVMRTNDNTVIKVPKALLIAGDSDPEGDSLSIVSVGNATPAGASVAILGNFIVYSAPGATAGNGSFTYDLSDGAGGHLVAATVTVSEIAAAPDAIAPNAARIVSQAGSFTITSQGVPGSVYRFQYTTSSSAPYVWNEFSPPAVFTAPNNGVFQYVDANPPGPLRLYRVISNR